MGKLFNFSWRSIRRRFNNLKKGLESRRYIDDEISRKELKIIKDELWAKVGQYISTMTKKHNKNPHNNNLERIIDLLQEMHEAVEKEKSLEEVHTLLGKLTNVILQLSSELNNLNKKPKANLNLQYET